MDNEEEVTEMTRLNNAVAQEIARLKEAAKQLPELAGDYQEQAFGVFALWMNLAGYHDDDENKEIAQMREFCTDWASMPDSPSIEGHEPAFCGRRAWHLFGVDRSCCTSPRLPEDAEYSDDAGGSLDAPMHMAAGSCFADHCLFSDVPQSDFKREHWPLLGESERPFADRRGLYRSRSNCLCTSGGRHPCGLRYFDAAGNNLDSPEFVATGATKQVGKLYGGMAQVISRNCLSLEPLPEPFTARRGWWRKWAEAIGVARSGPLGGMNLPSVSRPGFECESLDAPEFLPSGSVRWVGVDFGSTGFPSLRLVVREFCTEWK